MNNKSPLIIESPQRQGGVRRVVQGTLTLGLWLLWLYLMLPVFEPLLALAGIDLSAMGMAAKVVDVGIFVLVLALVGAVMLGFWLWARYNTLLHRFRRAGKEECASVGRDELADSFGICPLALTDWHGSGQLVIRLTEQGGICSVKAGELKVYHFAQEAPANEPLLQDDALAVSRAS
ncbi:MAG TPA: poly-beta-1,6-N-acetyl-D-glucosamine biosynthesis protein PgaD [Gammaproteobacteria bacterium]|nr:poly-beta-1,6-N-acetyl-D-glucosamine biosynthesis protein PgaD [Gammaproteobacteria bacterium]